MSGDHITTVPLARLLLDHKNVRLHNDPADQAAAIAEILRTKDRQRKVLNLARDIATYGRNPADLLILTPEHAPTGQYIVLDGNRRLTAMRLLNRPDLGEGILSLAGITGLRNIALLPQARQSQVNAVVFPTREAAAHWIHLRHAGELDGAGHTDWDSHATDNWETRESGTPTVPIQVLKFLQTLGLMPEWYSTDPGRFPLTTLQRFLGGKEARARFGLAVDEAGHLLLLNKPEVVAKGIGKVVSDLAEKKINVSGLKQGEDRDKYLAKIELPNPEKRLPSPIRADAILAPVEKQSRTKKVSRKKAQTTKERRTLIPKDANLYIPVPRIQDICEDLQRISVDENPNSVGIVFRVFLELSVDDYIRRHGAKIHPKVELRELQREGSLERKIRFVTGHLEECDTLVGRDLSPIRTFVQKHKLWDSRLSLYHGLVHSESVNPVPMDLKRDWNNLSRFFHCLWPQP